MPATPPLDGLPLWLQVIVTIMFGAATLGVAFKGYRKPHAGPVPEISSGAPTAAIIGASIADMGAIRRLSDTVAHLDGSVVALTTTINENIHWSRNQADELREVCQEIRVLTLEMQHQGRDARDWNKRDEDRRNKGRRGS